MGQLLDSTGKPTKTTPALTDDMITQAILGLRDQLQLLNQQQTHLGLFCEFLVECIMSSVDAEGEPLITIDPNEFPDFAQKRMQSLREEAFAAMTAQGKEMSEQKANDLADLAGVDLSDE